MTVKEKVDSTEKRVDSTEKRVDSTEKSRFNWKESDMIKNEK